jgi:hypothetical protein
MSTPDDVAVREPSCDLSNVQFAASIVRWLLNEFEFSQQLPLHRNAVGERNPQERNSC